MVAHELDTFWSVWIDVIVLGSIFGCVWLIWITRRSQKFDSETEETMGHTFDGIAEYDNPMPKWWLILFLLTIGFSLIYLLLYPGLGNFKGALGWTQYNQYEREVEAANEAYQPLYEELAARTPEDLISDEKAMNMGQRLFANNCAVCHGSAGRGAIGFPNLTDDDWLYGGSHEKIVETLKGGRNAAMPAWQNILGNEGIREVAHYVRGLSGQEVDTAEAGRGAPAYASYCAACHGAEGKGNPLMGAPNLTDGIWLYGGSQRAVEMTLRNGRAGVMPRFQEKLGDEKIHLLAAYVVSLSRKED